MVTSTCPDRDDLRSFHLGMLDERRELEVLDHLNDCPTCEDTVANLEGTADSLVAAVRSSGVSSGSDSALDEDRPALQQALAEIEGLVDPPSQGSPALESAASPVSERIRDYELLGTLGEGGMGTVYRARHTRLDRQVALKLLPTRRLRDNAAVARFEREMKAIGRLDHPTIVRATDAGDVDGTHFLAMDYVEGIDLSKLVRVVGPLDVASACEIVRQAALGLDYAHQQDLIHRDVKPSNLMLTLRGEVRILDLGLALFGAASEALDELTTVGQLMGTLDYMAPEQGDNSHDVDARADVYSLGATLFKLLTATAPYDSPGTRTPLAKMKALATIDAPSVAERRSELPADLVAVVDRSLLRNVDDRFASAKELAESLQPFCEGHLLSDLVECGRDLAMHEEEKIPQLPTLPPFVQKSEMPASPANVTRADNLGDRPPGVGRRIATWMLVPLILLTGIVIWIQTDNGVLVVESPEGSVPIEIRTGGKFHRSETLSVGKNELTIRSGTYEIVLSKEYDSLKVENHVFTLKRGGQWVARISKKDQVDPPSELDRYYTDVTRQTIPGALPTLPGAGPGLRAAPPGSPAGDGNSGASGFPPGQPSVATLPIPKVTKNAGTLVFSGKTFEEWQRSVLTERNPVELRNAVEALCILGRNNRDAEAASTVLQVVDAYPCQVHQLHQGGSEAELVVAAIRYLRTLAPSSIAPAVVTAARNCGTNTRTLILGFLAEENGGPMFTLNDVGQGASLAIQLRESSGLRDALIDIFTELKPDNQLRAFNLIVENLNEDDLNPTLVTFLENCCRNENPGHIELVAARRLTDIRPSARLADVFLTYLENRDEAQLQQTTQVQQTTQPGSMGGAAVQNWWSFEADAWLGLAALGRRASGSADRIARLINNVPNSLAKPQTIYLMASPSRVKTRFEIHRQLLPIEILAMIGPSAKSAVPAINNVLKTLIGAAPAHQGDYGFDGFNNKLVLERIIGQDARLGVPSPDALTADVEQIRDRPQRLDSALVAIRRITGQEARFELEQIDANGARKVPTGMDAGYPGGALGSGYPGGGSAGMMSGYGNEGGYGEKAPKQHTPRLVTYKGKSFADWTDPRNVANSAMSLGDLRDVFRGASLLAKTPQERTSAAEIAISTFEYAIRQPWKLTQELREFLVETVEASHSQNPTGLMTPIEDTLAQVSPERQAFLLAELLVPVEESDFGFRLHERPYSREVVVNPQFPNAYNDLIENWDKHPSVLQEAMLQVEAHLPALGRKNSVRLLTRLVKQACDAATSDAKTAVAMTDLQLKAALVLAATSPKDPAIQGQLEKLLVGILARPHVLRRNIDDGSGNAPQLEKSAKTPTMRDLDADQLHAAVALKLACGGQLSEATARQFATLIIQDTERHEIGTFRIVSPPDGSGRHGLPSGVGQFDTSGKRMQSASAMSEGYAGGSEYSDAGAAGGDGYPGMASGMPSRVSGLPGMVGAAGGDPKLVPGQMTSGKYPDDTILLHGTQGFIADHGEFSRRVLLIQLLLSAPPEDAEVREAMGEQLAASLLKRYPEIFMPAPKTESDNASVYDVIEVGFRSGIRYRKQPDLKKGAEEMARFVDAAGSVVWNYLPVDRARQLQMNRIAELQAAQTAALKPKQLFDGRPFEEWRQVVATERSPERLAEAVTALAILGKNGRDTEAAEAILECLAPFSANSRGQKTPEGRLVSTIDDRFWQLDKQATAPVTNDLIENGNSSQRKFLLVHNNRHMKEWLKPGGLLAKPQFVNALLQATHDDDSEVRWQATTFLMPLLLADQLQLTPEAVGKSIERLTELLTVPRAQTPAAICLSQLAPETSGLADILLAEIEQLASSDNNAVIQSSILRDNHDSLQFLDAYWALRKLIVHDRVPQQKSTPLLLKLLATRRAGSPGRIFEVDYFRFDHRTLIAELLVSGAPPSDDSKATIRTALETIIKAETQWANRKTGNRKIAPAPLASAAVTSESTTDTLPPKTTAYTPILTDDYPFPLPSAIRYPQSSAWEDRESHQHADELRAAKWALEQLEKSSLVEKVDK